MRLLNVADFNWMTGAERNSARVSLFDICRKFTHAATRAGDLAVEFSDRAVARIGAPLGLRRLGAGLANRRFLQVVDELKPDLILLHFADQISNAALAEARRLSPGVVIADINIDPIDTRKNGRRLGLRSGVADALFVTTAEPSLAAHVGPGAFAAFLPNPVDRSVETGRAFEILAPPFDLLFPATDAGKREIGGDRLTPSAAVEALRARVPALRVSTPGVSGAPAVRGYDYLRAMQTARLGWSLSRRSSLPLYASDRMAHFFGHGLGVALDRAAGFERFYGEDEALFYNDLEDLAARLRPLLADDPAARAMARRGWEQTWALFDSGRIWTYVQAQLFNDGGARGYEWPCERWGG
jgi:hypothetical protein